MKLFINQDLIKEVQTYNIVTANKETIITFSANLLFCTSDIKQEVGEEVKVSFVLDGARPILLSTMIGKITEKKISGNNKQFNHPTLLVTIVCPKTKYQIIGEE